MTEETKELLLGFGVIALGLWWAYGMLRLLASLIVSWLPQSWQERLGLASMEKPQPVDAEEWEEMFGEDLKMQRRNPATGLPMMLPYTDIAGNAYGSDDLFKWGSHED